VLRKCDKLSDLWADLINGMTTVEEEHMWKTKPAQEFVDSICESLDALGEIVRMDPKKKEGRK